MTVNTSRSGGFLAPVDTGVPLEDAEFEKVLRALVVGLTGLDGRLVRPRWTEKPLAKPALDVNWAAIGVTNVRPDANAAIVHHPGSYDLGDGQMSQGYDEMVRHETVEVMGSFYGPNSGGYAARLRDGLEIAQNRETLFLNGMGFIEVLPLVDAPDLMPNDQVVRRFDVTIRLRRSVTRIYPVENLLSAEGDIISDTGITTPFNSENATDA